MPGASPAGACHPHPQWMCFPRVVLTATSQTGPNLLTVDISASEQSFLAQGSGIKGCGGERQEAGHRVGGQGRILRVGGCTLYRQAPQGLTSGAQGHLVRETMALGCLFTSHLPRVPGSVSLSSLGVASPRWRCWAGSLPAGTHLCTGASPGQPCSWKQDLQELEWVTEARLRLPHPGPQTQGHRGRWRGSLRATW